MTNQGEPGIWLERFPLGEARPFTHEYGGLTYTGEVIRANRWSPYWGEPLEGEIYFRIVLLRQRRKGVHSILDPRTALCLPGAGFTRHRSSLSRELATIRETQSVYLSQRDPEADVIRRTLYRRQESLEQEILGDESVRYATGQVITGPLQYSFPDNLFGGVDPEVWLSRIARRLLSQAYPSLPLNSDLLPRTIAAQDPARLWEAIFEHPGASRNLLVELAPGLGLVAASSAGEWDSSACPAFGLIREWLSTRPGALRWADAHRYVAHDLGLTGPLATLYLLLFLSREASDLEVRLSPDHRITLVGGRALPGRRLTADLIPLLRWDRDLESSDWTCWETIGPARQPEWNDCLLYLSTLCSGLSAVEEGEDFAGQEIALLESVVVLAEGVIEARQFLELLGQSGDNQGVPPDVAAIAQRLSSISGDDFNSVCRTAREAYDDYRLLEKDLAALQRLAQLSGFSERILAVGDYLRVASVPESAAELFIEAKALEAALAPESLLRFSRSWEAVSQQASSFKAHYAAAYRAHHRTLQQELPDYQRRRSATRLKLTALELLNALPELGEPTGREAAEALDELWEGPPICAAAVADLDLERVPWCPSCLVSLDMLLPTRQLDRLLSTVDGLLGEKNRRLSNLLVDRILQGYSDERLDDFLKIVQASDLSALSNTMSADLVDFIKGILR